MTAAGEHMKAIKLVDMGLAGDLNKAMGALQRSNGDLNAAADRLMNL